MFSLSADCTVVQWQREEYVKSKWRDLASEVDESQRLTDT